MTNNNPVHVLRTHGLPTKTRIAARDVEVGDWVLLRLQGSRSRDWHQVLGVHDLDERRVSFTVQDRRGTQAWWWFYESAVLWRSLTEQDPPTSNGVIARRALKVQWPSTSFKVLTVTGGVAVRWTDGPSYEEVAELLSGSGVSCRRMIRTRSAQLIAAAVLRADSALAPDDAEFLPTVARAWADQGETTFQPHEWAPAQVLATVGGAADIETLCSALRRLGRETLEAIAAPPTQAE